MPSSLVFAALAVAWIVVLVPMVAKRRQEVRRTADTALAARVLRRGDAQGRREEVPDMAEHDAEYDTDYDDDHDSVDDVDDVDYTDDTDDGDEVEEAGDGRARRAYAHAPRGRLVRGGESGDDGPQPGTTGRHGPDGRRYRPGRGGFDPHAAELAARAKYAFRQRVVLGMLLLVLATAAAALVVLPVLWWAHGASGVVLVGYLGYLRQQVRIEQEVRQRRLDRVTRSHRVRPEADDEHEDEPAPEAPAPSSWQRLPQHPAHPGATVIDLDDEDPGLHDLDLDDATPYRRAAGE
ncbi:MAG TPA: gephyrin-like molybdotransferase receptor GlpR [Pseudonocardiaceae bacterium]